MNEEKEIGKENKKLKLEIEQKISEANLLLCLQRRRFRDLFFSTYGSSGWNEVRWYGVCRRNLSLSAEGTDL